MYYVYIYQINPTYIYIYMCMYVYITYIDIYQHDVRQRLRLLVTECVVQACVRKRRKRIHIIYININI